MYLKTFCDPGVKCIAESQILRATISSVCLIQMNKNANIEPVDVCNLHCGFFNILPPCLICDAPAACVQLPQTVSTVGCLFKTLVLKCISKVVMQICLSAVQPDPKFKLLKTPQQSIIRPVVRVGRSNSLTSHLNRAQQ